MVDSGDMDRLDLSCERCAETPGLRLHLGCGRPPSLTLPGEAAGGEWSEADGRVVSPFERSRAGQAPYTKVGLGELTRSWPWCPRWFAAFNAEADIGGRSPDAVFAEAAYYIEAGSAAQAYPGAFTPAMFDGLAMYRAAKAEAEILREQRKAKRRAPRRE